MPTYSPTFDEALASTLRRAVQAAVAVLTPTLTARGGVRRPKRPGEKTSEQARLGVLVEVLDRDFRWYGEWGTTAFAIEQELRVRAKVLLTASVATPG